MTNKELISTLENLVDHGTAPGMSINLSKAERRVVAYLIDKLICYKTVKISMSTMRELISDEPSNDVLNAIAHSLRNIALPNAVSLFSYVSFDYGLFRASLSDDLSYQIDKMKPEDSFELNMYCSVCAKKLITEINKIEDLSGFSEYSAVTCSFLSQCSEKLQHQNNNQIYFSQEQLCKLFPLQINSKESDLLKEEIVKLLGIMYLIRCPNCIGEEIKHIVSRISFNKDCMDIHITIEPEIAEILRKKPYHYVGDLQIKVKPENE